MPFQTGSVATHDDGQHTGSAKRQQASGVAGLDANSLVPNQTPIEEFSLLFDLTGMITDFCVLGKNGAAHDISHDTINLEADVTTGTASTGYSFIRTAKTRTPSTKPTIITETILPSVNGTGSIVSVFGMSSDFTAQVPAEAACLRQSSSGSWYLWTRTGGAETLSSAVTITSGNTIRLEITTTSVSLYVNGVLAATNTTNVSSTAMYIGFGETTITGAPAVARTFSVSYLAYKRY